MNRYIEGLRYPENHPFRSDAERLLNGFHTDINIKDGIIRWKSNDNIPPKEILEFWKYIGFAFNYNDCITLQERETQAFLNNYSQNRKSQSEGELDEMRAAFGSGKKIIDVVTGKVIKL